ncbi:hypothetical protein F5985_06050 [Malikia spinosa]|uniref:Uncharacterized protein n=2 Tax=Malikia spinosa TaxID=86180 RepID=A0A7C9J5L3_9BURK|nr:hypothetical protein [Malikia spinosa]
MEFCRVSLGPDSSGSGQSLHKTYDAQPPLGSLGLNGTQPTWLTPAYLRQHRSGDRISRFR